MLGLPHITTKDGDVIWEQDKLGTFLLVFACVLASLAILGGIWLLGRLYSLLSLYGPAILSRLAS